MELGLGIALGAFMGVPSGALLLILYGDVRIARMKGERDGAVGRALLQARRARIMHRRAQKVEGRLQRIDQILAEGETE